MTAKALPLLLLVAVLSSCGGGDCTETTTPNAFSGTLTITSANPGATSCVNTQTVTFTSTGASPRSVTLAGGDCLVFASSTGRHQPTSDPHPTHTQCPELNAPILDPGAVHTTAVLSGPKTCGFHDHLNPPATACMGGGGGIY